MSSLFQPINGAQAIVTKAGVSKQVKVATRNDLVYAVISGGYVRLRGDGGTSVDKMTIELLDLTDVEGFQFGMDRLGNLAVNGAIDALQTRRMLKDRIIGGFQIEAHGQLKISDK